MQKWTLNFEASWKVLGGTERSQAAVMEIAPGQSEGGPKNRHDGDQWMVVLAGIGTAMVDGRSLDLSPGTLLLIRAGETHEIRNTGDTPLRTVNIYSPPVYGPDES